MTKLKGESKGKSIPAYRKGVTNFWVGRENRAMWWVYASMDNGGVEVRGKFRGREAAHTSAAVSNRLLEIDRQRLETRKRKVVTNNSASR